MNGFTLYYEEEACFDCGEAPRVVVGYFKGVPSKEVLTKLAKKYIDDVAELSEEEFQKCVNITDWSVVLRDSEGYLRRMYEVEQFKLLDVK